MTDFDTEQWLQKMSNQSGASGCGGCSLKSSSSACGTCGPTSTDGGSGNSGPAVHVKNDGEDDPTPPKHVGEKEINRREMMKMMGSGAMLGSQMLSSMNPLNWFDGGKSAEKSAIDWAEFFKSNFRLMTEE
ncbi:MAG: hypothetical protein ABEK50_14070, partial [bacterium]